MSHERRTAMRMRGGWSLGLAVAALAGLTAGCFVEITHVKDARAAFAEARLEARRYQGRPGPAHNVNVLVYDPSDGELVRVSVPMWLVRKLARHQDGFDLGDDETGRKIRRHLRVEDIEKAGL